MNSFDHISERHFTTDGAELYYETKGDPDKPILLMLHGGFGTIADFNPVLPTLNNDFYVIGVDSRGHGKSSLGGITLNYQRLQKDVEALLNHLNIQKLSIMGFSDGGIVAYRLAAFNNLTIDKLITIGSRWQAKDLDDTRGIFEKVTAESWKAKFPETYHTYQKLNPDADFDKLAKEVVAMWLDESPSGYPGEQLEKFKGSLLIVRGDTDHLVSRKSVAELAGLIKNATLLSIPFANHVAFADQPEIFRIALRRFLDKE